MTIAAVVTALVVSSAFGWWGVAVARRLPPRHATWLLSAGGVVAALSSLAVLVLLGSLLAGEQPAVANEGHWSAAALRDHAPVGLPLASAAALLAGLLIAWGATVAAHRTRTVLAAYRSCRELPAAGELIVVPGTAVGAYAVPGRPGRIVAGQQLLRTLSPGERRVLLAHERAHLAEGHHWHLAAVTIAGALNPLLRPLRPAATCSTERWADEAAGEAVGDRTVVARALAAAALCASAPGRGALAATTHFVPLRVVALLAPAPAPRPLLVRMSVGLLLAAVAAVLVATKQTEHLYEFARTVDQ